MTDRPGYDMSSIVGTKGQVVIEKAIRDALCLKPGYIAVQRLAGDRVEITFVEPEHDRSLRGILSAAALQRVPVEAWLEAREEAWREAVADQIGEPAENG